MRATQEACHLICCARPAVSPATSRPETNEVLAQVSGIHYREDQILSTVGTARQLRAGSAFSGVYGGEPPWSNGMRASTAE